LPLLSQFESHVLILPIFFFFWVAFRSPPSVLFLGRVCPLRCVFFAQRRPLPPVFDEDLPSPFARVSARPRWSSETSAGVNDPFFSPCDRRTGFGLQPVQNFFSAPSRTALNLDFSPSPLPNTAFFVWGLGFCGGGGGGGGLGWGLGGGVWGGGDSF